MKAKAYLMVDEYMLDKLQDKIKETLCIKIFDDAKILIEIDDKLPDELTLKSDMILIMWFFKDFDSQLFKKISVA